MINSHKKLMDILSCPTCHLAFSGENKTCQACERTYPKYDGILAPINDLKIQEELKTLFIKEKTLKEKIKDFIPCLMKDYGVNLQKKQLIKFY